MRRKPPQLDKPYPRHRPVSEEEAQLWQEEAGEKKKAGKAASKPKQALKKTAKEEKEALLSSLSTPSHPQDSAPVSHIDRPTLAKLRRGSFKSEARLDLHFLTQQEAYETLLRFIVQARERDLRAVIVITGKGRAGGGTLRTMLPLWLEQAPLREHVSAYHPAGPRHGGEGAWYVRLRKGIRD